MSNCGRPVDFFTTTKAFRGQFAGIQKNALRSWVAEAHRAQVDLSITIFGESPGSQSIRDELNIHYCPKIRSSDSGLPLVSDMFGRAQNTGSNSIICYSNADIIFAKGLLRALNLAACHFKTFLLVGRRTDLPVGALLEFGDRWAAERQELVIAAAVDGKLRPGDAIDYFGFVSGTFGDIPDFRIGRPYFDNWLIWHALSRGVPVIDATKMVLALHQLHSYAHELGGESQVMRGADAEMNRNLSGGWSRWYSIDDANYILGQDGSIDRNLSLRRLLRRAEFVRRRAVDLSRPLRKAQFMRPFSSR